MPGISGPAKALRGGLCGSVAGAAQRAVGSGLGLTRVDAAGPGQGHGPPDSRRPVAAASRAQKLTGENTPSAAWCPEVVNEERFGKPQRPVFPGDAGVNKETKLGKAGHPCAELHRDEHLCRRVMKERPLPPKSIWAILIRTHC